MREVGTFSVVCMLRQTKEHLQAWHRKKRCGLCFAGWAATASWVEAPRHAYVMVLVLSPHRALRRTVCV